MLADRFLLLGQLGKGGMGVVYRAWQLSTDREVAVKVLPERLADSEGSLARFLREAKVTASLRSPHTVTVHDFGKLPDGSLFLAMELLQGRSLQQVLAEEGPLSPGRVRTLLEQVCLSLEEAHGRGLVHRDLKPANVMVERLSADREHVRVVDFGIVKVSDEDATVLTQEGALAGTPAYMGPELAEGGEVGPATDVYALGVMAFEMLAGIRPFRADTLVSLLIQHKHEPAPRLATLRPGLTGVEDWDRLIQACLAKKPEERFATVERLRQALPLVGEAPAGPTLRDEPPRGAPSPPATLLADTAADTIGLGETRDSAETIGLEETPESAETVPRIPPERLDGAPGPVGPPPTIRRRRVAISAAVGLALAGGAISVWFGSTGRRPETPEPRPPAPSAPAPAPPAAIEVRTAPHAEPSSGAAATPESRPDAPTEPTSRAAAVPEVAEAARLPAKRPTVARFKPKPKWRPGAVRLVSVGTTGGLDEGAARKVLRPVLRKLTTCWRRAYGAGGDVVTLMLMLARDGRVKRASVRPAGGANDALLSCGRGRLEALRFPAPSGSSFATVKAKLGPPR